MPLASLVLLLGALWTQETFPVQVAPFTQAAISGSQTLSADGPISSAPGTLGSGVDATRRLTLSGLKLNPTEGLIEVWVKPRWAGNDGKRHLLWSTGPFDGRELYLEKSELGMLRAVIRTPEGMTVSRSDVSSWRAGQWRHIAVGWTSHDGANVGLPLWIDKVCVDGQITAHGVFKPDSTPTRLTLSDAIYDELIVRPNLKAEGGYGMIACVYRDFFRTAPFSAIRIDTEPGRVPSDSRAVVGYTKQLGLLAENQGDWQPLVENVVRYSQWAYFDARRLIQWTSSDMSVAWVDPAGKVNTRKPGRCEIRASFHGLTARYALTVISSNKPDLDAINIELLPRFRSDAVEDRLRPGQPVTAVAHVGNFGLAPLPAGAAVRLSLIWRLPHEFRHAPKDKPYAVFEQTLKALGPGEETTVEFHWPFPAQSTWMKLELDPENKIDELCKANNTIEELTDARPVHMGYNPKFSVEEFQKRELNHVGSFSYYDWIRAEKRRLDGILGAAVYPTTGPYGVEEAYRIDRFTPLELGKWDDEPFNKEAADDDGGYPVNEKVDLGAIDCAIIHELGHTILQQPDLYGYVTGARNVFVTDDDGKLVAGTSRSLSCPARITCLRRRRKTFRAASVIHPSWTAASFGFHPRWRAM